MVWLLTLAGCFCFSQQWLPWVGGCSRSGAGLYSWRADVRPMGKASLGSAASWLWFRGPMGYLRPNLRAKWTEWTLIAFLSLPCGMEEGAFFYYRLVLLLGGRLVQWRSLLSLIMRTPWASANSSLSRYHTSFPSRHWGGPSEETLWRGQRYKRVGYAVSMAQLGQICPFSLFTTFAEVLAALCWGVA